VKLILDKANYYPEDVLTDKILRSKLADYVGLDGMEDWITVGNGSMEIIDMLYKTFLDEGDEVLVPTPDYSPYARRAPLYGARVVNLQPSEEFCYSADTFLSRTTPKTKMIFTSSPNNPTGYSLSQAVVKSLCASDNIVVIDEAYAEFARVSICDMVPNHPNLIVSRTFSKAMGLAGIRLGFVIANPEVIGYINRVRTPLNISLISHTAAIAAIEDRKYIEANVQCIIHDRDFLYLELSKLPGLRTFRSNGNFILLNCRETGKQATEYQEYFQEKGYLIRAFVNGRGLPGNEYFRITIGTHEDVLGVLKEMKLFLGML
jgi:histidinol-phosphate aminotransferase